MPWTSIEKHTIIYVMVTQISLLNSGLIDRASAIEMPPLNPPHVRIPRVFWVILSFILIATEGIHKETYRARRARNIKTRARSTILGFSWMISNSAPIRTKSMAFRISSISSQNLSVYSAVLERKRRNSIRSQRLGTIREYYSSWLSENSSSR